MFEENQEIVDSFYNESKSLVVQLVELLEKVEGDFGQIKRLEVYGQTVDRIMGAAKSIALAFPEGHLIYKIGDVSAICKAVGYQASQIKDNEEFFNVCVALLLDATELLDEMLNSLKAGENSDIKEVVTSAFVNRLKWVSSKFGSEVRASVAAKDPTQDKMSQGEIDDLLKKLGL
ncbi:MAG: hypothetical protein AB7O96_03060 [Pseudobdellovibrionaceae bacterium]